MNPDTTLTLDDAVAEVLGLLTGLDLTYDPELDRYRAITRQLNRALRLNALEREWSYYSAVEVLGNAKAGDSEAYLRSSRRVRIINDDAVRLVDSHGHPLVWAYFLPRDALHKYAHRSGLWCSVVRNTVYFSRPFYPGEDGLEIQIPVMREPRMFRLPATAGTTVPDEVQNQPIDFAYPDVITMRAAFLYAQTDPVMQPRVQTLEAQYKDLMYQVIERDERSTDSPFINDFFVPISGSIDGPGRLPHGHPHSDERRW